MGYYTLFDIEVYGPRKTKHPNPKEVIRQLREIDENIKYAVDANGFESEPTK